MDTKTKEYKVVVAGSNSASWGKNLVTEVYSSLTRAWKVVESHPVQHLYQTSAIHCNGYLYSAGNNHSPTLSSQSTDLLVSLHQTDTIQGTYIGVQTLPGLTESYRHHAGFDAILAYDLQQEKWRELKGPALQNTQLMLPQICECNGCLLMVEVVSEHFLMSRVSIWALRQFDNQWFKLTSMPHKILEEVISISGR